MENWPVTTLLASQSLLVVFKSDFYPRELFLSDYIRHKLFVFLYVGLLSSRCPRTARGTMSIPTATKVWRFEMSSLLSEAFAGQYGLIQEKSACLNLCSARSAPSKKELWSSRTRQAAVEHSSPPWGFYLRKYPNNLDDRVPWFVVFWGKDSPAAKRNIWSTVNLWEISIMLTGFKAQKFRYWSPQ